MELSLTTTLLHQLKNKKITDADRQRAALHVLDWLGCCSLAKKSVAASVYQAYIDDEPSHSSSVNNVVFGDKCYWQDALLINGALGNVLEMDDIHRSSILHPGPVVIPAALVIAQKYQLSMRSFLNAVILGYEITIRLGESIGRSHYQYFHNTATCAAMGASLAVSHLLDLSVEQSVHALGNVGSRTGGLWQMRNEKVLTKQWHNSEAAKAGVMSAVLAKKGLSGPEYILEGPQGIFNAFSTDAQPEVFIQESDTWRMYDCSFKPWPACRHAHPAIDAMLTALSDYSHGLSNDNQTLTISDILSIEIYTYKDAKLFCDNENPETELQAKFSIQHAVAAILKWGEPQLSHYHEHNIEQLAEVRSLISVYVEQEFEANYPFHFGARCVVKLKTGETLSAKIIDTLGDPEKPLSVEQLKSKAHMLMTAADIPAQQINDILNMKWSQESELTLLTSLITNSTK